MSKEPRPANMLQHLANIPTHGKRTTDAQPTDNRPTDDPQPTDNQLTTDAQGETPRRQIRIPDPIWEALQREAQGRSISVSALIRIILSEHLSSP